MCGEQLQVKAYKLKYTLRTAVRWPKSLTNRDSWPSDPEVFRRELTRPFSPALLLSLYRWGLKSLSSSNAQCSAQRQKRRLKQRQGHVSNAVHPRAGLTGLAGGPGSPADAPRGKPPHDDASPAGTTFYLHLKCSWKKTTMKLFPFRTLPCCLQWTLPRSLQLYSTAQFRSTLLCRYLRHCSIFS